MSDAPKLNGYEINELLKALIALDGASKKIAFTNKRLGSRDNRIWAAEEQIDNAIFNIQLYLGIRDE